ncbi:hypothetical protein FXO38_22676 [Capsicum annuum]|nr:hypothetical protein FXO38_22676 [Capsicum annuum]KAF3666886.1 hypothetical protein FXO37_10317 [Capsicum annuum]
MSSMVASKHPYPPCLDCTCTGNYCKQPGETVPYEWSELIGTEIHKAKVIVERTNPNVTAVVLLEVSCIHIFNDKLTHEDPNTKLTYGHDQRENIVKIIAEYEQTPQKSILVEDKNLNYVSRRISAPDGNKMEMMEQYLAEVRHKLLQTVEQNSDTSMKSDEVNTEDITEFQPPEIMGETDEVIEKAEAFVKKWKEKD